MTDYNATATLTNQFSRLKEATTDSILDHLGDYSPAIGAAPTGHAEVVITLPADNLQQAIRTATALVLPLRPIGLEVLPTEVWDKRLTLTPLPQLLSVTEAAERLGVTRQAILQRIESGSIPASKIGTAWVIVADAI